MLPMFIRKFIVDFAETGLATLFALAFAFPQSVADLKAIAVAAGVGVVGAAVSAGRRAVPGFLGWLRTALSVPEGTDEGGDQT